MLDIHRAAPVWAVAGGAVLIAIVLSAVLERTLGRAAHDDDHADDGAVVSLYSTAATIYAILLAFIVVIVWQQFSDAEARVDTEATKVSNVLRDIVPLDVPEIHDQVIAYLRATTTDEWDTMAEGKASPAASAAYQRIWDRVYDVRPADAHQQTFYSELVSKMNEFGAARRSRLLSSQSSVPALMWAFLLVGGLVLLAISTLLPGCRSRRAVITRGAAAGLMAITLVLVFVLDHPFSGQVHVRPDPLVELTSR